VAFLVAAVAAAAAAGLISVLACPTRALLEESSWAPDFLLLIFPTFGQPLGFGPERRGLRLPRTLRRRSPLPLLQTDPILGCAAMLAGLHLETCLPTPLTACSLVLGNLDLAL
jgi:hypothetical protein